jgi:type IV pilus assembly protein PilA
MKKMDNKGFSLVELIIVIAIMAILVGVLAPQFVKYVEQSRQSGDLQTVDEVKTAIETYVADYGLSGGCSVEAKGKSGGGITYTTPASGSPASIGSNDLSSYGIAAGATPQKSEITLKWDYTDFKWTLTTSAANSKGTLYYDADGNKLK